MNRFASFSVPATVLALLLTACSSSYSPTSAPTQALSSQGKVFGGEQPITAATLQLYAVNTSTDGGASTPLLTATVTTSDGSGDTTNANANASNNYNRFSPGFFTLTGDYTCPSAGTLVYLAYTGGNPGAGINTAQRGLVALGACGDLSANTDIVLNEVTTVGTVAALHNYMSAWNAIGATPTNASALANAFNAAAEYIDSSTGTAPGPLLPSGDDASSNDLRALANVVQSCVNSNGSTAVGTPCSNFFTDAEGSASSTPTDTVAALLDIAADPTNNVAALFGLQSPTPPFQPTNSSAPVDWSLPILSPPSISPNGGSYTAATTVTLADTDPTAAIYYTTNGNVPTASSTKYTAPFSLTSSGAVRAIAIEPNGLKSPISTASFEVTIPTAVAPTVSLTPGTTATSSTGGILLLASSNAAGSTVTFGTTGLGGSFNPATCFVASGGCTTVYTPSGSLSANTYSNDITASFSAVSGYLAASATSTLTLKASSLTPTQLLVFTGAIGAGTYTGRHPNYVNLMQASDGLIYGTTELGGYTGTSSFGVGNVFSLSPTSLAYNVVYNFNAGTGDGADPYPGVIESPNDGQLYGTTFEGGTANVGVIYKVQRAPNNTSDTVVHIFTGTNTDGDEPFSNMVPAADGNLYGAMYSGGTSGNGSIYKVSASGTYTQFFNFTSATTGGYPRGSLVQHPADGFLYGTAYLGGANSGGTIFKVDTSGNNFTVLHNFYSPTTDGKSPVAGLIVGPDGYLYGTTAAGGANAGGTLFKIDYQGNNYTVLYNFAASSTDAKTPDNSLFLASDGYLYGTTSVGGASSKGTIFRISPTGANYSVLYSFGALPDGETPLGGIMQASDGNLYGTTSVGGNATNSYGEIFRMTSGPAPIQIAVPTTVTHGTTFTLAYTVSNAYSSTLQTCFATNNAGDVTGWIGTKAATVLPKTVTLTAPSSGTYTYALTCGGTESGFATLTVQ